MIGWLVVLAVLTIFTPTALYAWALARMAADADRAIERILQQKGDPS